MLQLCPFGQRSGFYDVAKGRPKYFFDDDVIENAPQFDRSSLPDIPVKHAANKRLGELQRMIPLNFD